MANVRYMGGSSSTLGTKEISENGVYNASSDSLDGYSSVTVDVPAPTGSISLEYTGNGQYSEDVSQYATADITVDVPIPTVNTQTKTITASTSQQTVTPDPGYLLEQVTVNPQQNTGTYTPASDTASNDMGPVNNYRYVNTSGMILPSGSKTVTIDSNGSYTEDVTSKASVDITVNVPVSGDLGTKTIITNGTYQALTDNLDGYSEVTVNVPQNATLGIKTINNNGTYNAITDGYDGFSRVDVNVAGATLQTSKSVTATTSQQTVTPDVGYDGMEQVIVNPQVHTQTYTPADNTAANDMGANNNYRYVDTSGMYTPTSITPSNSTPAALTSGSAVTPTANGYAVESVTTLTPSNNSPATITDGTIYKANGNGQAIGSFYYITPTDSSPEVIYSGTIIKTRTRNGYLCQTSPSSITPSNSSPVSLSTSGLYKPSGSGYAISSYSSKTPSDSSPASVSSGDIIKASANGYLYSTVQPKVKTGTVTLNTSNPTKVTLGFKPKYLCAYSTSKYYSDIWIDTMVSNKYIRSTSSGPKMEDWDENYTGGLVSIDNDGFTLRKSNSTGGLTYQYFAIG